MLYQNLSEFDPELDNLIKKEEERQRLSLELIASENFTSISVLQANCSVLTNKYSEGEVGNRYYGGNQYIDQIESLCKKRALELYNLNPEIWDVNVQALSGSAANLAVYTGLIGKDGKLMGLELSHGGHLTHGYQTKTRKISASSMFFNSKSYKCNENGLIDYGALEKETREFKPDIIICGASAYPRDFDYKKFREIAGSAYLMMDMTHISGLIATGHMNNPFEYCDVVTTTTHKILRGPRSAMIFYRKVKVLENGQVTNIKSKIDSAVFPGLQGGPHNQKIGALAVALKQAKTPEYKRYVQNVLENARVLSNELKKMGYKLYSDGTNCHLLLICLNDLRCDLVEKVCELANISLNKNCIPSDKSPLKPSGLRLGTPALTSRGFGPDDFREVAKMIHQAIIITKSIYDEQTKNQENEIKEFLVIAEKDHRIAELKERVINLASKFKIPVFNYRLADCGV